MLLLNNNKKTKKIEESLVRFSSEDVKPYPENDIIEYPSDTRPYHILLNTRTFTAAFQSLTSRGIYGTWQTTIDALMRTQDSYRSFFEKEAGKNLGKLIELYNLIVDGAKENSLNAEIDPQDVSDIRKMIPQGIGFREISSTITYRMAGLPITFRGLLSLLHVQIVRLAAAIGIYTYIYHLYLLDDTHPMNSYLKTLGDLCRSYYPIPEMVERYYLMKFAFPNSWNNFEHLRDPGHVIVSTALEAFVGDIFTAKYSVEKMRRKVSEAYKVYLGELEEGAHTANRATLHNNLGVFVSAISKHVVMMFHSANTLEESGIEYYEKKIVDLFVIVLALSILEYATHAVDTESGSSISMEREKMLAIIDLLDMNKMYRDTREKYKADYKDLNFGSELSLDKDFKRRGW